VSGAPLSAMQGRKLREIQAKAKGETSKPGLGRGKAPKSRDGGPC